jgi:hypothetical protein
VYSSSGKITFAIVNSCNAKDFENGNAHKLARKLRKIYIHISAPSLVKTQRIFREDKICKDKDQEIFINILEYFLVKSKAMGSNHER